MYCVHTLNMNLYCKVNTMRTDNRLTYEVYNGTITTLMHSYTPTSANWGNGAQAMGTLCSNRTYTKSVGISVMGPAK
jgi:hypothetical protein